MQTAETPETDIVAISRLCRMLGIPRVDGEAGVGFPTVDTALQVAELLCQSVVDDGFATIMLLAPDARILFANPALSSMLGYPDNGLEGVALGGLLHPDDAHAALLLLARAGASETRPVVDEVRMRRADGMWLWVELKARESPLSPGRNILCGVLDVTGRRAVANALVDAEASALITIESALDAIVSMDPDGRICAFNAAAEAVFGWSRANAIGLTVAEVLIPVALRDRHHAGLLRHLATGNSSMLDRRMELTALHADGHEFPVEITVTWFGAGAARRYTAFIRDISERRRLVADLRAAAGRLAAVVEAHQQLAASDAGATELIDQIAALACELLDGRRAVLEPLDGDAAPDDGTGLDRRVRRHPLCEAEAQVSWPLDGAQAREICGQSLAVAPLHAGDRVLGHVKVLARDGHRYTDADAHALELFAGSLGGVIQRRQSRARQASIIAMQREVAASELPLQPLMALMCERAQSLLGGDATAIEWTDGEELLYVAASGWGLEHVGIRVAMAGSLSGLCASTGAAMVSLDAQADPRADRDLAQRIGVRAMAVAPLRAGDTLFGVLKVMSRRPGTFAESDAQHLQVLAESMGAIIQRRRDAERLAASEAQYRLLFNSNPHPMWVSDAQTQRFLAVNAAALALYGWSERQFLAMTEHDHRLPDAIDFASLPDSVERMASRHHRSDGSIVDVEVSFEPITFAGRPARLVLAIDVTQRLRAEAAEARATRAQALLSACNIALVRIADEQQLLDEICRSIVELGGYRLAGIGYAVVPGDSSRLEPKAVASLDPQHAIAVRDGWEEITSGEQCPAAHAIRTNRPATFADLGDCANEPWCRIALVCGFGSAISLPLRSDGVAFGFLSMYAEHPVEVGEHELALLQELADNTAFGISAIRAEAERKQFLAELAYSASHDAVTGLQRYALLELRLVRLLTQPGQETTVAVFDIDRFSSINETLGHDAADAILRQVGVRLSAFASEHVSISHFASDEFVVVTSGLSPDMAGVLVESMRAAIAEPIDAPEFSVLLTATVGISHSPAHGSVAGDLVRRAQAAMETGKRVGRDCSHVFLTERMQDLEDRALLGARLRLAMAAGELRLYYQPQYGAATGRMTGFEALVRWHSPELGTVSPARFIPIAETLGLMPLLGTWVVREACRQARAWLDEGHVGFRIAVNVSGQQLLRPGLVKVVADALREFAIPPQLLDLELTESSLMENVAVIQGTLADLKALGVTLSLDDFGTGYSSLAYLKHFSLDKLKIDQSFVSGLPGNADDAAIARTIVSMGHQLRLLVAAEGVETREQADFLRAIGCDELQGYHFGHPLAAEGAARSFAAD